MYIWLFSGTDNPDYESLDDTEEILLGMKNIYKVFCYEKKN